MKAVKDPVESHPSMSKPPKKQSSSKNDTPTDNRSFFATAAS